MNISKPTKPRPTMEEQIEFARMLRKRSADLLEKMKRENPDVVEWIRQGKPPLCNRILV